MNFEVRKNGLYYVLHTDGSNRMGRREMLMDSNVQKYMQSSQQVNLLDLQHDDADVHLKVYYLKYLTFDFTKKRRVNSKPHRHSFFELHLIMQGENVYSINDHIIPIGEGHFILVTPGVRHSFSSNTSEFAKFAMCFDLEFPDGSVFRRYQDLLREHSFFTGICDDRIVKPLEYIFLHMQYGGIADGKIVQWNILTILMVLLEQCMGKDFSVPEPVPQEKLQNGAEFLSICKSYIRANLSSKNLVSELARYLYLSERQLRRKILSYEGKSTRQLIDELRCERIRELLLAQERISDICLTVGLSDEHSLNRFFKRVEGQTPGEYRSSILKSNYPVK